MDILIKNCSKALDLVKGKQTVYAHATEQQAVKQLENFQTTLSQLVTELPTANLEEPDREKSIRTLLKSTLELISHWSFMIEEYLTEHVASMKEDTFQDEYQYLLSLLDIPKENAEYFAQLYTNQYEIEFGNDEASEEAQLEMGLLDMEGFRMLHTYGPDVSELYYWRFGSICYMYCYNTVNSNPDSDLNTNTPSFDIYSNLLRGMDGFRRMLISRQLFPYPTIDFNEATLSEDVDSVALDTSVYVEKGVLSSSHLLAVIFSAELYYWFYKFEESKVGLLKKPTTAEEMAEVLPMYCHALGKTILQNEAYIKYACQFLSKYYIALVKRMPKKGGWDTKRAEEFLRDLDEPQPQSQPPSSS